MAQDHDLGLIEHQLNMLVSARMMEGLSPFDERRYRELCEVERSLRSDRRNLRDDVARHAHETTLPSV